MSTRGDYLPGSSQDPTTGPGRPPKKPKLPAANDEEQAIQEAVKAITVSKTAIDQYKKDIDKIKATISVYNELVSILPTSPLLVSSLSILSTTKFLTANLTTPLRPL